MIPMRHMDANTFVRAAAIILLVANHSFSLDLTGGMNVLMLLAGLNLATFSFEKPERDMYGSWFHYLARILLPSFLFALACALLLRQFRPLELAMLSNLFTRARVSLFPIWYPQVILQMILALTLLTIPLRFHTLLRKAPLATITLLFAAALALNLISRLNWSTLHLNDNLPHLLLWNFVLGWLLWALFKNGRTLTARLCATLALALGVTIAFGIGPAHYPATRILAMLTLGVILIWIPTIPLPRLAAHLLGLLSQATLIIFLFHRLFLYATVEVTSAFALHPSHPLAQLTRFAAGLLGPLLLWALGTAFMRALHRIRQDQRGRAPEGVRIVEVDGLSPASV